MLSRDFHYKKKAFYLQIIKIPPDKRRLHLPYFSSVKRQDGKPYHCFSLSFQLFFADHGPSFLPPFTCKTFGIIKKQHIILKFIYCGASRTPHPTKSQKHYCNTVGAGLCACSKSPQSKNGRILSAHTKFNLYLPYISIQQ